MLQSIREHTQGWIAGAIISIIILTFALWGVHSYFVGGSNRVVATVNGVEIGRDQLTVAYERLRRQIQAQQGMAAVSDDAALKEQALKSIIDMQVLQQASTSDGFFISNQQVDNYLQNMPEFQVDGQFSVERFQQVLSATLMTTSDFLDIIKNGLLVDQPRLGIVLTSFALPDEAKVNVALVNQERDVEYIDISRKLFAGEVAKIDAASVKKYYEEHRDEYMTPEKVSIEYIELSVKDSYDSFKPAEAELMNYYNENVNTYSDPAAWKLAGILLPIQDSSADGVKKAETKANEISEQLEKGGNFESVAKNHPGKTIGGGELVTLNQVPAPLQGAVVELKEKGDISPPIKTDDGFVILKATEVRKPQVKPFAAVEQRVKDSYIHQKAEEKYAQMREKLADSTYEHPDNLNTAAKELNVPVKVTGMFTKDDAGAGVLQYKKVRDAAFSNDVMNLQNNSDVIQVTPESVVVLRIKSHVPSSLLTLDSVSPKISEQLARDKADEMASAFAKELLVKMNDGQSTPTGMTEKGLRWVTKGYIGRYSTHVDTAIVDLAFRLPRPNFIQKSVVYGIAKMQDGYALVGVKGVKDGSRSADQLAVFTEQYQNSEGMLEYQLYKQSQIENAKIKNYL